MTVVPHRQFGFVEKTYEGDPLTNAFNIALDNIGTIQNMSLVDPRGTIHFRRVLTKRIHEALPVGMYRSDAATILDGVGLIAGSDRRAEAFNHAFMVLSAHQADIGLAELRREGFAEGLEEGHATAMYHLARVATRAESLYTPEIEPLRPIPATALMLDGFNPHAIANS
jgi:hypothetical protein